MIKSSLDVFEVKIHHKAAGHNNLNMTVAVQDVSDTVIEKSLLSFGALKIDLILWLATCCYILRWSMCWRYSPDYHRAVIIVR